MSKEEDKGKVLDLFLHWHDLTTTKMLYDKSGLLLMESQPAHVEYAMRCFLIHMDSMEDIEKYFDEYTKQYSSYPTKKEVKEILDFLEMMQDEVEEARKYKADTALKLWDKLAEIRMAIAEMIVDAYSLKEKDADLLDPLVKAEVILNSIQQISNKLWSERMRLETKGDEDE